MSEYNHDRDWEISPEERSEQRQQRLGPPPETRPRADGQRARVQRRDRRPDPDQADDDDDPGLIAQILHAIFAPAIGFIMIVSFILLWSGFLFAILIAYSLLGGTVTITHLGTAVVVWMIGMSVYSTVALS